MRRGLLLLGVVVVAGLLAACCPRWAHHGHDCGPGCHHAAHEHGQPCCLKSGPQANLESGQMAGRADVLYACDCGPGCDCNTLSKSPGQCRCGKPLRWYHVIKVEGDVALLCGCAKGCECKLDPKDPTKCGCGKPVKRVSLKGSGLFFCNCGGSCSCNTVQAQVGQCKCGMKLHQAN